jgi:hypothetical protein
MPKAKTTKTLKKKTTTRSNTNYSSTYRTAGTALEVARAAKGKSGVDSIVKTLSAGTEGKPKKKIKVPKAGPGKKRVQGSGKTRAVGFSSTGGGGGEWVTIKGRRIPLGKG